MTSGVTTLASDWNDVGAAVDYVLGLRHGTKLNLIGWSQGGPRAAGWAAQHPDKVNRMVLWRPPTTMAQPAWPRLPRRRRHRARLGLQCPDP